MKLAKAPFSAGGLGKTAGTELGPDRITAELDNIFVNEAGRELKFEIEQIKVNNANIEESNQSIFGYVREQHAPLIVIGGDHSITYPSFKAFAEKFPNAGMLVLDAHPDLMEPTGSQTHEDYLRKLIDDKILKPENLIIVGIRNPFTAELDYIRQMKIKCYASKSLYEVGMEESVNGIMSVAKDFPGLYLSIDIDILDPAFAPGTGYAEPGGMSTRELLYLIQRVSKLKNLQMADIVEINPKLDVNGMTSKAAAKCIAEINFVSQ